MVDKAHTTETLRQTLFDTIDGVLEGRIQEKRAAQVANLADKIIKTADLEMRYTDHLNRVDQLDDKTGNKPGPMLLSHKTETPDVKP